MMGLLKILRDPRIKWNNLDVWRFLAGKLRYRVRIMAAMRFGKLPYLSHRSIKFNRFVVKMKFFDGLENKPEIAQFLRNNASFEAQTVEKADKILNHRFNLLGSGDVDLGSAIDWHCDFKTGYRWPKKYCQLINRDISLRNYLQYKVDVKVPWELSRLQHLAVLGQAYWLNCDEKYTREFMSQVDSWISDNPPEIGVNWACSMEVSLRVVSLIIAYFYFESSSVVNKEFWERYFLLLYQSGVHIEENQEVRYDGARNNHHLANCAAMLWLGLFFGHYNRRTTNWLKRGMSDLCTEMDYQVNPDGGNFEGSISYHRLALEIFLFTTILAEKNGLSFPGAFKIRLEKMCEFTASYTKQNGLAPQFGDADDGRFCFFSGYGMDDMRDHRSVLGAAGEYFGRDDFREAAADKYLDGLWLFGRGGKTKLASTACPDLAGYPDTGFYIVRGSGMFLMLKCGCTGQKSKGGHDHNDQLSFELNINGVDLIIDPGSYVYTADKDLRQLFRSTAYHNVSQIGDLEQNTIKNKDIADLFSMYSSNPGICTFFDRTPSGSIRFLGQITLAGTNIQYVRSVELKHYEKVIDITDNITGTQEEGACRLHLARGVQIERLTEKSVEINCNNVYARIEAETPVIAEPGMVSPSYGVKHDSIILCWHFRGQTNFKIYYT